MFYYFCVLKCIVQYLSILTQTNIRLQSSSGDRIYRSYTLHKKRETAILWLVALKELVLAIFIIISITVKPWYNEPLYNGVLGITNDFLYPRNSKTYGKVPRYKKTSYYSPQILPVPWHFVISTFHCSTKRKKTQNLPCSQFSGQVTASPACTSSKLAALKS